MVDVNLMGISKMIKAAFITMKNWRDCGSCPSMLVRYDIPKSNSTLKSELINICYCFVILNSMSLHRLVYTIAWLIQCASLGFMV